jgi:hypothetical protein
MTSTESQDSAKHGRQNDDPHADAETLFRSLFRALLGAGMSMDTIETLAQRALSAAHRTCDAAGAHRPARQDLDDLAHVLSVWHTDPAYVDPEGGPCPLRRSGPAPSFESLAALAVPGSAAERVLEQLIRLEGVSIDEAGQICALRRELLVRTWDETGFSNWQQSVRRYLDTLEFNYSVPEQGRFERASHSERLPIELLPVFNRWVREQGTDFVQIVDDWLTRHETSDTADADNLVRAGVGVYLFVEEAGKPS